MRSLGTVAVASAVLTLLHASAQATESVAGRYIPGMYAAPGAGIVPPFAGFYYGIANGFYSGDIHGDVSFPGGAVVGADVEVTVWSTALAGIWVPEQHPGSWTYAFQGVLPVGYMKTHATVSVIDRTDEMFGLGDISITPLLLGWHNNTGNTFFSASFSITAPTGAWDNDEIAFVGMNYWTFQPAIGFTHITADGWDFSGKFGIDVNTENEDTDYYSGAMAHLDIAVTKRLTPEFQLGVIAGVLHQFEGDDSTFADARDGFKGRSIAVGPLVEYKAKFDEREVDFSLSWAHEVEVENRMKGDAVFFTAAGKF